MEPITISEYFDILGKSQKLYAQRLEPLCRKWELTRNELDILLFLHNNPQYDRAADIVSRRGISKSHVSLAVTELERRDLLLRQALEEDRRSACLRLTEAGLGIAREARQVQSDFFASLYRGIPREELEQWSITAKKIRDNVEMLKTELD